MCAAVEKTLKEKGYVDRYARSKRFSVLEFSVRGPLIPYIRVMQTCITIFGHVTEGPRRIQHQPFIPDITFILSSDANLHRICSQRTIFGLYSGVKGLARLSG